MRKVIINSLRDKNLFEETYSKLQNKETYELFKLYPKYYLKDKAHTKGLDILLFEIINEELYIDRLHYSEYMTFSEKLLPKIILITNFLMELERAKVKIIGKKRKVANSESVYNAPDEVTYIGNKQYIESINKNKGYNWYVDLFQVRKHIRTLSSGKQIIVNSYNKIVNYH